MNILEEANEIIGVHLQGDRSSAYGPPHIEAEDMAKIIEVITKHPFKPEWWPLVMVGLKLRREAYRHKRDNQTDMAGYARVGEIFWDEEDEIADARKAIEESGENPRRTRLRDVPDLGPIQGS